jgi:LCP family protein required for cell wall assembly
MRQQPERQRQDTALAAVPDLLSRRQKQRQPEKRRSGRPMVLSFALGMTLGYGLAGPLGARLASQLSQFGSSLAGMVQGRHSIAAIIDPLGTGNRRVLVLGSDAVSGSTDVMFTVQVKDGTTRILQVPRDTFVESPQLGVVKANALYGMAGVEAAKSAVSQLVTEPVQHHLKVNLRAVARVADALGGVEIDVPKRMYYVDNAQGLYIDLYPGRQLLKGNELEGFLRFRHDELGDLGRMERQRMVINEVFHKLASPATLAQLPALLKIAGEDIRTDLSPIEMTQLITAMGRSRLSTDRLPGRLYWHHDLSYWMPDSNTSYPSGSGEEPAP